MIIAPFRKDRLYDEITEQCFRAIGDAMSKNDDDGFLICAGRRGTGKTSLMFHCYQEYAGEEATIDQVAFNQVEMSRALDEASRATGKRFLAYDEANVSKRDALTRWNKKLIDTYMNIRGLQIFHWWNNPSVEMLDKPFIEECVKGLIVILTKSKDKPRLFYYFTQEGLIKMLEDKGDLKLSTIIKGGGQYSHHLGWFRPYQGILWKDYLLKKEDRMTYKVSQLLNEFAPQEKTSVNAWSNHAHIGHGTGTKVYQYAKETNQLKHGEHYVVLPSKQTRLLPKGVLVLDKILKERAYLSPLVTTPLKTSHNIIVSPGVEM